MNAVESPSLTGPISIRALRDWHKGETIWVLGSGSSLNRVPRPFFDDKVTVGVNATHYDWPVTYLFAHHREDAQAAISRGFCVVASEYDQGRAENGRNELIGSWYRYRHPQQP